MEEENKDFQKELVDKIIEASNLIAERARKGDANYVTLPAKFIEKMAIELKIPIPEAIEILRTRLNPIPPEIMRQITEEF